MATEKSRTFDHDHAAIFLEIEDSFGRVTPHTIYLMGEPDPDTAIAKRIEEVEEQAQTIRDRMLKAGWKP